MEKRKTYVAVTALFALYIITVLCLTLLNLSDKTSEFPKYFIGIPIDKLAHFLMYFAYPIVGWLMFTYNKHMKIRHGYLFPLLFITGIAFAAFTEYAQGAFTTYRDSDPLDFLANIIGITSGCIIMSLLQKPAKAICDKAQQYIHNLLYK